MAVIATVEAVCACEYAFPLPQATVPFAANQSISIIGAGAGSTIVDANQIDGVLTIEAVRLVSLAGLTVRNGNHPASNSGGGISNSGTLTISRCVIQGNNAIYGGGIYNAGELDISGSTIGSNTVYAWGGGLALLGTTRIRDSTIRGNMAGSGGGTMLAGHELDVVNSTISGNAANDNGGGIFALSTGGALVANAFVSNTSIVYNDADHDIDMNGGVGGGIYANAGGRFVVANTLVAGNTQLGGNFDDDCRATLEAYGFNLLGDLFGCVFSGNGNAARGIISPSTIDATLRDNGGPTFTHALLPGSEAIDAAASGCGDETGALLTTDQRGAPRIAGARCDVGAFEYGSIMPVDDVVFSNGFDP